MIGSANSSNTVALEKLARAAGCARVFRINDPDELPDDLSGTVGVTAGASAPEELVEAVLARLAPARASRRCASPTRTSTSRRPRNLRDLLTAIDVVGALGLGGDPVDRAPVNDRGLPASTVLADLA